jgi:hypothetical protein
LLDWILLQEIYRSDPNIVENTGRQYIPWPFFRYTEMMFNYAEACTELGQDQEARDWLNKIPLPGWYAGRQQKQALPLKDRLRHEKRVENGIRRTTLS